MPKHRWRSRMECTAAHTTGPGHTAQGPRTPQPERRSPPPPGCPPNSRLPACLTRLPAVLAGVTGAVTANLGGISNLYVQPTSGSVQISGRCVGGSTCWGQALRWCMAAGLCRGDVPHSMHPPQRTHRMPACPLRTCSLQLPAPLSPCCARPPAGRLASATFITLRASALCSLASSSPQPASRRPPSSRRRPPPAGRKACRQSETSPAPAVSGASARQRTLWGACWPLAKWPCHGFAAHPMHGWGQTLSAPS